MTSCEISRDNLLPFAAVKNGEDWLYQKNNALLYNCKETSAWFQTNNVLSILWLALSMDFDPIQNLWAVLRRPFFQGRLKFGIVMKLKMCVEQEWNILEDGLRYSLVTSTTKCCITTLKAGEKSEKNKNALGYFS